jgi:hypothetical protein
MPHRWPVLLLIDVVKEQEQYRCYRNDMGEEFSLDSDLL